MTAESSRLSGPRFSVVVCTDGRPQALANTLRCLQYLDGPAFEVCVVRGPTEDGIEKVLAGWAGQIKVGRIPERNLSAARNLGIAMTAGEIVAFVDDDGLPEPRWLLDLAQAFAEPRVGAAGGIVFDHTGARLQYLYSSADRLGNGDWQRTTPAEHFGFPFSFNFPYVQGTNSAFRREALQAVGGFDEEYEFYLDETDVCCRLVDAGWAIRQLPGAAVHHKYLPSANRTADRVTRARFAVLKNKLYFSLINNRGHYGLRRVAEDMSRCVHAHHLDIETHMAAGRLAASDLMEFETDIDRAWSVGLERGLSGRRRLMPDRLPTLEAASFLQLPRPLPEGGRSVFVFVSQEYPPGRMGGIGRYVHQLARAVADLGHHVHVLTRGEGHSRVDFEDCVWVHRVVFDAEAAAIPAPPYLTGVPAHLWAHSSAMLEELRRIAARQPVTAVYAPIWDCEGAAILVDGTWPLVTGLQTTLRFWLDSHPHVAADAALMRDFAVPMLALETRLLRESDGVHAISEAIARDIAQAYGVEFDEARTAVVPLGLDDWSGLPGAAPEPFPEGALRLLFVGRLEARKGIDLLLEALPRLLDRHPALHVDIVGNDMIAGPGGAPYRAAFEASAPAAALARVRFHGEVPEDRLRGFYRACDLFVAPSRFESFGLILVEAMMYGKPAVACRAGGMIEVADDGRTALLAEPGDGASLEALLERLISDPDLRREMGEAARRRYEARFASRPMAVGVVSLLRRARDGEAQGFAEAPAA